MHPIWAAHPRTHLSTEYPPPPGGQTPMFAAGELMDVNIVTINLTKAEIAYIAP